MINVEIKFGKSKSDNYWEAIKLSREFTNFNESHEDSGFNVLTTDSKEILDKYNQFIKLYHIVRFWKSARIIQNNQEVKYHGILHPLEKVMYCSQFYSESAEKDTFCRRYGKGPGWGCMELIEIERHLDSSCFNKYWYDIGYFSSDGIWEIDKARIYAELHEEAQEKWLFFCRHFSFDAVNKRIEELPDSIDVNDSDSWKIKYEKDIFDSANQGNAVGIEHVCAGPEEGTENWDDPESHVSKELSSEIDANKKFIPKISFDDIGGIDLIIDKIREVIELPLKHPEIYRHLGIKAHKGILFHGEPGTGKTLVAKAVANEVKAHFIHVSGPELINMYYGQSEENLRNVFREARAQQPSIIFFDEIDSIASRRMNNQQSRHDARLVNQLLTLMDGIESYENVTVLASTNRPELIDDALLRPGRFDYKIEILKPDQKGCYAILQIACKNMPLDTSLDLQSIVPSLSGLTGAEIVFVAKEAAINALKRSVNIKDLITGENADNINYKSITVKKDDFMAASDSCGRGELPACGADGRFRCT